MTGIVVAWGLMIVLIGTTFNGWYYFSIVFGSFFGYVCFGIGEREGGVKDGKGLEA